MGLLGLIVAWTVGIATALALGFGAMVGLGWLLALTYNAFAAETWPHLTLWPAVGIVFLVSLLLGRSAGAHVQVRRG